MTSHSSRPTFVLTEPKKLHWWAKPSFLFSSLSFLLPSTLCFQHHRAYDIWYKSCWWRNPLPKSLLIPPALGIFPLHSIQVTTQELHASPPHFQISPFQETHSKSNIDITYILVMYLFLKRPLGLLTQINIRRQFHLLKNTNSQKLPNHGLKQLNTKFLPFFITSASPIQSNLDQMDQWPHHTLPHIILDDEKYMQKYKYKYKQIWISDPLLHPPTHSHNSAWEEMQMLSLSLLLLPFMASSRPGHNFLQRDSHLHLRAHLPTLSIFHYSSFNKRC